MSRGAYAIYKYGTSSIRLYRPTCSRLSCSSWSSVGLFLACSRLHTEGHKATVKSFKETRMASISLARTLAERISFSRRVDTSGLNPESARTWIIITAVVTSVIGTAVFATLIFTRYRNRQYREALEKEPCLSRRDYYRRRKLSAHDLQAEEERQRAVLIRKSLASRSAKSLSYIDVESVGSAEEGRAGRLLEQWKPWEVGVTSKLAKHHRHPSHSSLLDYPIPAQTVSSPPSRIPVR